MLSRSRFICHVAVLASVLALFEAIGPAASAGDHGWWGYHGCKCDPGCEVFSSDFYGYYRTCWRPWPGGQPECPVYLLQPVPLQTAKEPKPAEALPTPMPIPSAK